MIKLGILHMIKHLFFYSVIFISVSCTTPYTHLKGAPGTDYFKPEFDCNKGLLRKEKDLGYQLIREHYRSIMLAKPVPENPFMVIAGESTAALFSEEIYQSELAEFPTVNRAIGGETTGLFLSTMDADIISLKPKVVFLSIGGNDILDGRCISKIKENMQLILLKFKTQLPETRILLAGVPPVRSWKVNSVTPYFNDLLRNLAAQSGPNSNIEYFDLWPILADPDRPMLDNRFMVPITKQANLFQRLTGNEQTDEYDLIHFNQDGYREIARNLKPILQKIKDQNQNKK